MKAIRVPKPPKVNTREELALLTAQVWLYRENGRGPQIKLGEYIPPGPLPPVYSVTFLTDRESAEHVLESLEQGVLPFMNKRKLKAPTCAVQAEPAVLSANLPDPSVVT